MALESGRVNSHREAVVLLRFRNGAVIECEDALIGTELLIATTLTIDYQSSSLAISTRENIST